MIRAVFMDYTGTIVQEGGKEIQEIVRKICHNSSLRDSNALIKEWYFKTPDIRCCGSDIRSP